MFLHTRLLKFSHAFSAALISNARQMLGSSLWQRCLLCSWRDAMLNCKRMQSMRSFIMNGSLLVKMSLLSYLFFIVHKLYDRYNFSINFDTSKQIIHNLNHFRTIMDNLNYSVFLPYMSILLILLFLYLY